MPNYYKGVQAVALVYDVTNETSFDSVEDWMDILKENADLARVALTLVGNKIDLAGEREVEADQGRRLASQFSIPFCEVSARSAEGVDFLFKEMARRVGHVLTSPARALKLAPEQDKGCCF